jgi:hypothetical protein
MGFLVHVGATIICPHAGQASCITSNTRVLASGQPIVTQADTFPITGCPFTVPVATPHPCVAIRWLVPSLRILVGGKAAILQDSTGICQSADQAPQGPANIVATQIRANGV